MLDAGKDGGRERDYSGAAAAGVLIRCRRSTGRLKTMATTVDFGISGTSRCTLSVAGRRIVGSVAGIQFPVSIIIIISLYFVSCVFLFACYRKEIMRLMHLDVTWAPSAFN